MTKTLTRAEMYELVWAEPMTQLAKEMGVSDVALHKICKRHNIPKPPRGYWAKLATGKVVKQTPLPASEDPDEWIDIRGDPHRGLADRLRARIPPAEGAPRPPSPSPQVEKLRKRLQSAHPKKDGFIHLQGQQQFRLSITPACSQRALKVIDNIVKTATSRGYSLKSSTDGLGLEIAGELIAFSLTETLARVPHESTQAERNKLARWQAKTYREKRLHGWASEWDKPEIPQFDHVPSGYLALEINPGTYTSGIRRHFCDGKRQRIDKMSDQIVNGMEICAAYLIEEREEHERWQHEWERQEALRRERERIQTLEKKRFEYLVGKLERLEEAMRLEKFVAEYCGHYAEAGLPASFRQLLDWATRQASKIRDEVSPKRIASTLDKYQLMDDTLEISSWVRIEDD